jgi:hypothetical protein
MGREAEGPRRALQLGLVDHLFALSKGYVGEGEKGNRVQVTKPTAKFRMVLRSRLADMTSGLRYAGFTKHFTALC